MQSNTAAKRTSEENGTRNRRLLFRAGVRDSTEKRNVMGVLPTTRQCRKHAKRKRPTHNRSEWSTTGVKDSTRIGPENQNQGMTVNSNSSRKLKLNEHQK